MAEHYITKVAQSLKAEAQANATAVSAQLAPPDDGDASTKLRRSQMVNHVREQSMLDPTYLQKTLDRMAPVSATMNDGTPLRAPNGVKNFHELMREARPDIYAQVTGDLRPLAKAQEAP